MDRALAVLEAVGARAEGIAAKELAEQLGLALPTTYHLLGTLVDAGYVAHLPERHRYALGHRVRELQQGLARQLAVPAEVAAAVRALHRGADAAAYYAVYRSHEVVVSHVEDSERRPRITPLGVGFHEAPHATAFGKVMLAAMEPAARATLLAALPRTRLTPATVVADDALAAQLAQVARTRVALEVEEFQRGWSCLASPVHARGAVVGAVAVSVPAPEFPARRPALETAVREAAARVTRVLAGR